MVFNSLNSSFYPLLSKQASIPFIAILKRGERELLNFWAFWARHTPKKWRTFLHRRARGKRRQRRREASHSRPLLAFLGPFKDVHMHIGKRPNCENARCLSPLWALRPNTCHLFLSLALFGGSSMNCWTSDAPVGFLQNPGHENEKAPELLQFAEHHL